jgi:dephospho-CoA kinase
MQKIGITGSIGSGKSIVCNIFNQLGVPVYNADIRAKELMVSNLEIIEKVKLLFGYESYFENGELNRKHIAEIVFNNKNLLSLLNKTLHPIVFKDFDDWLLVKKNKNFNYIIKEAALMFETDSYKSLDKFIVVTAPIELRVLRTMKRDLNTKEQVLARMNNQLSQEEKLTKANFEIKNDGQISVIVQVVKLHEMIIKQFFNSKN